MFIRKTGIYLQFHTALGPRRPTSTVISFVRGMYSDLCTSWESGCNFMEYNLLIESPRSF
jgi:hypothetical protein